MNTRTGSMTVALAFLAIGATGSANATCDEGLGTWQGAGTASEVSGKDLGAFTVTVTRKLLSDGHVRADGIVMLANHQRIDFWQEFENKGPHAFRIKSNHGTGGGRCFENGLCQSLEQSSDGHAFATTIAPDGTNRIRVLITELEQGQPVRFYQQTLTKIP